jgi:hypothetical protein
MIWALLLLLDVTALDLSGLCHDACVRTAIAWQVERTPRPAHWATERTWGLCWRTPAACAVEGCP